MARVAGLSLYPIKSCGGIALQSAQVGAFGLEANGIGDREWMLVDADGLFLSQRELPALARVRTAFGDGPWIELSAPGLPVLRLRTDEGPATHPRRTVAIWSDQLAALDAGEAPAVWFSGLVGAPVRLARFDDRETRHADPGWTGGLKAKTRFPDGFPILLLSQASLEDLNARWTLDGKPPLDMARFRPNVVLEGIGAYEEDFLASLRAGALELRPVKPCPRCTIPAVNPASGEPGPSPLELLMTYRFDPAVGGATFGQNAVVTGGAGATLAVGQAFEPRWNF